MSEREFAEMVEYANGLFAARVAESHKFAERILHELWEKVDIDGSLLYPAEIIDLAEKLKGTLYVAQFGVHTNDGICTFTQNAEYLACVTAALNKTKES